MIKIDPIHITSKFPSRKAIFVGPAHQLINGSQAILGYCAIAVIYRESQTTNINLGRVSLNIDFPPDSKPIDPSIDDFHFDTGEGGAQELLTRIMPPEDEFEKFYVRDSQRRALMNLQTTYGSDKEEPTSYHISYGNLYPHVVCAYGELLQSKTLPERVDTIASREAIAIMEEELRTRPAEDMPGLLERLTEAKDLLMQDYPSRFVADPQKE